MDWLNDFRNRLCLWWRWVEPFVMDYRKENLKEHRRLGKRRAKRDADSFGCDLSTNDRADEERKRIPKEHEAPNEDKA